MPYNMLSRSYLSAVGMRPFEMRDFSLKVPGTGEPVKSFEPGSGGTRRAFFLFFPPSAERGSRGQTIGAISTKAPARHFFFFFVILLLVTYSDRRVSHIPLVPLDVTRRQVYIMYYSRTCCILCTAIQRKRCKLLQFGIHPVWWRRYSTVLFGR